MEPIDRRITAAKLMALREEPGATAAIAELLEVATLHPNLAARAHGEIEEFVRTGDATLAAQLLHATLVRNSRN